MKFNRLCFIALVTLFCLHQTLYADARHPEYDGPGSFGPLHMTVYLEELRYVGDIESEGRQYAIVRQVNGKVHRVSIGSYIGEHNGSIIKIEKHQLTIQQLHSDGKGSWMKKVFYLKRSS